MSTKTRTAVNVPSLRPKPRTPRLVILQGPDIGRQIRLDEEPVEIGRGEEATVRVDSDLVSRRHACILPSGQTYLIRDMGSTNGTYVNARRIERATPLREGDQIKVGKVILRYTEDAVEARYHEHIVEQARVDALTGAYNKGHFREELGRAVERARSGRGLSLVLLDIDHFKRINDTHGHEAGDVVLSMMADVVRDEVPETGLFARVGGEEFGVLLDGTDLERAHAFAERVRLAVEAAQFSHDGVAIPVTLSLGVAELGEASDGSSLFRAADERLYEAKRGGRNRVC